MNDQLESELREGFAGRAALVPEDSSVRLRTINFRPRTSLFSTRFTVGSLTGAAAATGAIVSVVVLGSAPPAFAGWTAVPAAAATPSATAATNCQQQLTNSPTPTSLAGARWTVLDTDVRGPYTVIIYQSDQTYATCFTGPSFTIVHAANAGSGHGYAGGSVRVQAGQRGVARGLSGGSVSVLKETTSDGGTPSIAQMTVSHLALSSSGGDTYTLVDGQLASGVSGVTLMRSDGSRVHATSGNGWLVAWWPNDLGVASAEIDSPSGRSAESFTATTPAPPSAGGPYTSPPAGGPSTHSCGAAGPAGAASGPAAAASGPCSSRTGQGFTTSSAP
jgi:hypothetical protein